MRILLTLQYSFGMEEVEANELFYHQWTELIENCFTNLSFCKSFARSTSSLTPDGILTQLISRVLSNNTSHRYSLIDIIQQVTILWEEEMIFLLTKFSKVFLAETAHHPLQVKPVITTSQFRFKQSYTYHRFPYYNGFILLFGEIHTLAQLVNETENDWNHRHRSQHTDRVDHLIPISLQQIWKLRSMKKMKEKMKQWYYYLQPYLAFIHDDETDIKLHFHIEELLVPYLVSLMHQDPSPLGVDHTSIQTQRRSLFHIIQALMRADQNCKEDPEARLNQYGVLLTVEVKEKNKKKKLKIDIPGGKREITETSLECALRETYEEIGFDFSSCLQWNDEGQATQHGIQETAEFVLYNKVDVDSMSCFPICHRSLVKFVEEVETPSSKRERKKDHGDSILR